MSTTITDVDGLQAMGDGLTGDYILGGDIDASITSTWNLGNGFIPIGFYGTAFTGTFDGKGYTISSLFINRSTADSIGLFGVTDGATITDAVLTGVDITGDDYVGGLVGYANASTITGSSTTGDVKVGSGSTYVGGLAGLLWGNTITSCHSSVTVNGSTTAGKVGGFAGWSRGDTFTSCYATGAVTGNYELGGFVGSIYGGSTFTKCYATGSVSSSGSTGDYLGGFGGGYTYIVGTAFSKCYATGDVTSTNGTWAIGGFVGVLDDTWTATDCYAKGDVTAANATAVGGFVGYSDDATLTNCYSVGAVSGDADVGGFCGDRDSTTIASCYWDTETSGTETSDGGVGATTAQMKTESTFTDWDFTCIWNINSCLNSGYPYFRWTAADGGGETRTYTLPPIYDEKRRVPKGATARAYRSDTGALVETETLDSSGKATFTELPNDTGVSIHITWGGTTTTHKTEQIHSTIIGVTEGGTGASDEYNARSNLGLGSEDSPQFTGIELGDDDDTTIARAAAGRATIESVAIVRGPASATDNIIPRFDLTTGDLIQQTGITADDSNNVSGVAKLTTSGAIELGHASDTTVARAAAGRLTVESVNIVRGPGSSTDNAIARFNSTTGDLIQDYTSNPPTISDTGDITVDGDLTADNIVTAGNVDGIDVSAHDVATTGVHGAGANTLLNTGDVDDTPVNGATTAPASSNWAFDHNAAVLSTTVHNNNNYFLGYGNETVTDPTLNAVVKIPALTAITDPASGLDVSDWYGASGAYRQSDADSDATHIEDDDASFPSSLQFTLVKWASNAAGDADVGIGYVSSVTDADTLVIAKFTGTNFGASYYYWIKHSEWVVPVTGIYYVKAAVLFLPSEADKRFEARIWYYTGTSAPAQLLQGVASSGLTDYEFPTISGVVSLTANDHLFAIGQHGGTSGTPNIYTGHVAHLPLQAFLLKQTA